MKKSPRSPAPLSPIHQLPEMTIFTNFDSANLLQISKIQKPESPLSKPKTSISKRKKIILKPKSSSRLPPSNTVYQFRMKADNHGQNFENFYTCWFYFGVCGVQRQCDHLVTEILNRTEVSSQMVNGKTTKMPHSLFSKSC